MADLFDLIEPEKPVQEIAPPAKAIPCMWPFLGLPGHQCSVGGGDACCTINGGHTWQCTTHVDPTFYPRNR